MRAARFSGLLVAILAIVSVAGACRRAESPPVVLISIDTLRADHLPAYGYRGVETPALDALARDAIVFENAYCQVPLTLPSHAVILTGRAPYRNGVRDNLGFRLDPSIPTLASMLKSAGYATAAAVSTLALRGDRGLDAGFDLYDDRFPRDSPDERPGTATVKVLEDWMGSAAGSGNRVLLFLHLYEPHAPYAPPEPFRSRYASRLYDGEIAAADAAVGRFLDALRRRRLYDRALIVFLSDHGEGLGDHGEDEHGVLLNRESIRVPLFVKLPGSRRKGERIARPVGLVDVLPTIAARTGAPPPGPVDGVDLLAEPRGAAGRRIYAETLYPRLALGWSELYSLVDSRYQFVEAPRPELYDLVADPAERQNLAPTRPDPIRSLRAELARIPRSEANRGPVSAEEVRKLGALGYISVSNAPPGRALPDPKDRLATLKKYKKLFELFYARQDTRVLPAAAEILAEDPAILSVWRMRATSRERLGDPRGAAADLESALASCPDAAPEERSATVEQLAADLARSGDRGRAEKVLRDAISGPLASPGVRTALARLLTESGRSAEALDVLPPGAAADSSADDARGVALAETGRLPEARAAFDAALQRDPGNASILLHRGMLALRERDPAAARGWFEKALAAEPDAPGTLSALGLAQVQLNDAEGAYASWSRAVARDPSQFDALFNLALLAGRMGKTEDARHALERFVATAPASRYRDKIAQARQLLESLPAPAAPGRNASSGAR